MMKIEQAIKLISARFGDYKQSGDEIQVCCPFCELNGHTPDENYKLYINPVRNVFNCFRCGSKGRSSDMIPQLGIQLSIEDLVVKRVKPKFVYDNYEVEPLPPGVPLTELPKEHPAIQYLSNRDLSLDYLGDRVYFTEQLICNTFTFGPRLIFPVFQAGTYRGYTARTILDDGFPKYKTAHGMVKAGMLYNFDTAFSQSEQLVITEGVFDCLRIGDQAVALFGKSISEQQIRLIHLGDFKRIIFMLDPDAKTEMEVAADFFTSNYDVYICHLPEGVKDPGDLSFEQAQSTLKTNLERIF